MNRLDADDLMGRGERLVERRAWHGALVEKSDEAGPEWDTVTRAKARH